MYRATFGVFFIVCSLASAANDEEHVLHSFQRIRLTDTYYSEGANFGDLDNDGFNDIVYGPYWFAGPDYSTKHEIYKPVPQPTERYADNFFSWVYDFNQDGNNDLLVVGFPGTPAHVYENPGKDRHGSHWPKHEISDWVSNESPQFTSIVGDKRPELICTRDGFYGYLTPNWAKPFGPWTFHRISRQVAASRFGHGLGVGDVDGDKRPDVLASNGWFRQPVDLTDDPMWQFHPVEFAPAAADIFAYDVDGDGDNDVITSLDAHNYGLAWYEQSKDGDTIAFKKHLIMGTKPTDNKYGVLFTEPHSVNLVDINGDGLKDICTGKTYYSHHKQSPMWDAGAVVFWFELRRAADGVVDWIPHKADDETGIGRQLVAGDINDDELPDFVVGGMKGCHVLIHSKRIVDELTWLGAQPQPVRELADGLSPQAAAEQMTVHPGFKLELAAGEPQIHQPIAFTTDHRGRLWVAEAYTYPIRAEDGKGRDKIVILEDTDLDGTLDSRKVFAEGLNLVSGLEVGFGGVWVGAAPYLLFIPDRNGDDVPDAKPQVLLDGFGYQDTHETLNAFIWGPDGWLYGCHGVFTHSQVGKPGTPGDERTPVNATVWRYHPTRHEFDVFARGTSNPWGVDFNDHGHAFITACVIPHLYHVVQGARYQRQGGQHFNPYLYDDIKTIADHSHYEGDIRDHAWWGHEPQISHTVSELGGGHAHCGAMIYLADNWPQSYRNSIYFNNVHGNRVNNDILKRRGSGYVGSHGKDLLLANDRWYRGINLKYGPDGTVHLIDWYDKNACHRTNPEIWDRSNGRIYRLSFGDVKPISVDLSKQSDAQLARHHLNPNEWYVRMARRLLQERAATATAAGAVRPVGTAVAALKNILATHPDVTRRLRALWTLHVINGIRSDELRKLMEDSDEHIRSWAVQLDLERGTAAPAARLAQMAREDSSQLVRLYLASALQRLPLDQRWEIAAGLVSHEEDADDHNLPLMIWYGVEPLVPSAPQRALRLAQASKIPRIWKYTIRRASAQDDTIPKVITLLYHATDTRRHLIMDEVLASLEGRANVPMPEPWTPVYNALLKSEDTSIREKADRIALAFGDRRILPRMRDVLADDAAPLEARERALDIVVAGNDREGAPSLIAALGQPKLRSKAIKALAAYDHTDTPNALLSRYDEFTDEQRQDAISTLASRVSYATTLLDAIESGTVNRKDVHAFTIRQLQRFEDEALVERLQNVWGTIRESSADKKARIAELKRQLDGKLADADLSNGRLLFNKTCATCHVLFGYGEKIGPDITGSNRANLDYILENAIDPSAVVGKDYQMTSLILDDGRAITGLIQRETDSAITIRTFNDSLVVAKADVEERALSPLSLMPEGQLDQLSPTELRDLIAYLGSPVQIALPRVPAPIDTKTGRVPSAIEGETMKVVGKSAGNARSQPMSAFRDDKWSGNDHLWWTDAKPGDQLELELSVESGGTYTVEVVMTMARDYGIVQLAVDDQKLGGPIDLYNDPQVQTTGVLSFDNVHLDAGTHAFIVKIVGANPNAIAHMVGLDYVRVVE